MKRNLLLAVFISLLSQLSFVQDFDSSKLDAYFNALETHTKFRGSVAVSKDGKIIYTRALGFAPPR